MSFFPQHFISFLVLSPQLWVASFFLYFQELIARWAFIFFLVFNIHIFFFLFFSWVWNGETVAITFLALLRYENCQTIILAHIALREVEWFCFSFSLSLLKLFLYSQTWTIILVLMLLFNFFFFNYLFFNEKTWDAHMGFQENTLLMSSVACLGFEACFCKCIFCIVPKARHLIWRLYFFLGVNVSYACILESVFLLF